MSTTVKQEFAARLHEICDDMHLPSARGRQTKLAALFGVSPNAARKWLHGLSMPEIELAVTIAKWAGVNLNWLIQGVGPKHGTRVEAKVLILDEALHILPPQMGLDMIDNLRSKLERLGKITAEEPHGRYNVMLDAYEKDLGRKPN